MRRNDSDCGSLDVPRACASRSPGPPPTPPTAGPPGKPPFIAEAAEPASLSGSAFAPA